MIRAFLFALLCLICSLYTALATNAAGVAFLVAKGKEEGVVTLPSGLMYKELRAGNALGKTPGVNSPCDVNYVGTLIDGTEFDRGEPAKFSPSQVIKGWTEAMQLMKEGAKWELYIPSDLAYGEVGAGSIIPPGAALVFQMEMLKVHDEEVKIGRMKYPMEGMR